MKRNIEREKEIINLIVDNWTLMSIATKFNITKQRVYQIVKRNDISIWEKIRSNKKTIHPYHLRTEHKSNHPHVVL